MRLINWKKIAKFACRQLASQPASARDRFYLMRELAGDLSVDYRFKWPDVDWWHDAQFNDYLREFGEIDGMNTDRRWMLCELQRMVADVPGDTAECGVYRGASSYLICLGNQHSTAGRKVHHLFDSFEGLSAPSPADGEHWTSGDLAIDLTTVQAKLGCFPDTAYYPGWIPTRFAAIAERSFSFVHIDVDLHQPTFDSIAFFYPRLADGAILLCDDYGIGSCPGATKAVDDFLADKPEKMLCLSGGAGFFVKGQPVATRATSGSRNRRECAERAVA